MLQIEVEEYLNAEIKEAVLRIRDGDVSLLVFSDSFDASERGNDICLYGFMTENIQLAPSMHLPMKTDLGFFSYHMTGVVANKSDRLIQIGNIKVVLSTPLPKDIPDGAFISFDVARLDYD